MSERKMRLGVSIRYVGAHAAAWRDPDVPADGGQDFSHFIRLVKLAEAGLLDMVFLADSVGIRTLDQPPGAAQRSAQNLDFDPVTLLAALAPMTRHVGLVATASTSYNEPYHVARRFASLDHISGGRAGWNVVTSWSEAEAWNFNRDHHMEYDDRYARASEFADVVTGLWDSWDDGAFVRDKASGIFYDSAKMRVLDHKGKYFQVRGPLSHTRTLQGRPVIVQAGSSEQGQEIAAAYADVVYGGEQEISAARAFYAGLKGRLAKYGRRPEDLCILPGLVPVLGRTEDEAQEKFQRLQDLIHPQIGLSYLYTMTGDLSAYPVDGPVPEPNNPQLRSYARVLFAEAHAKGETIRQLYERVAGGFGTRIMIGTPAQIADDMELWFSTGAADGFNFSPATMPGGLDDVVTMLVPELQRRGLFRQSYEGHTLRENLGIGVPPSRYAGS